jgi:hypothetical protein
MLYSMSAAFSADKMDLGKTNIMESYIDLRDKEPGLTKTRMNQDVTQEGE